MKTDLNILRLMVDSPLVTPASANFRPPTWPPGDDFPVVIDKHGNVITRYGEPIWNMSPWHGKTLTVSFGDGRQRRGAGVVSQDNARLLRQITAWWMYRSRGIKKARTICDQILDLKPLFVLCSQEGILASKLSQFPAVADKIADLLPASRADGILLLLHNLFEHRDEVGFMLLDREGLRRLAAALPDHENQQTPYIPPRIWTYQLGRLRAFLDDFLAHQEQIERCYHFCLKAYTKNYGSLTEACSKDRDNSRCPFSEKSPSKKGAKYYGSFSSTAKRFGLDALFERWRVSPGKTLNDLSVSALSSYFTDVGRVSLAYILNFSLMRIAEGQSLRVDCLQIEVDKSFGPIYLLRGVTTKSIEDDDARWVASPSVQVAVDAATTAARLRLGAAKGYPGIVDDSNEISNPHLLQRSYEPWGKFSGETPVSIGYRTPTYGATIESCCNLFDDNALRITEEDLQIARLVTPTLDSETFQVGKVWPLAWHQLRRTGMVNMQASGIVSDASAQYQAKHATRDMSLYYGQGYSQVRLNDSARKEYIRTMYEMMGKEIERLFTDRFVSPYGVGRKAEILRLLDPKDAKKLVAAGKSGQVACRQTLLGICTKRGPCEYGGIDNIIRCGGGDGRGACNDALFDREKRSSILELVEILDDRLASTPAGSPLHDSLIAQQRAAENALDVLAKQ